MPRFTGPCLFPGTHEYVFYFQIFPQVAVYESILLSLDIVTHSKADLESEGAPAAVILRNTLTAAEPG